MWMKRCTKYKVDVTKPKIYQFFDLPFYDNIENSLDMKRSGCSKRRSSIVYDLQK